MVTKVIHQIKPGIPMECFLRIPEVENIIGCKKSTIYTMLKQGKFPSPIKMGSRMVVWPESVILQWIQDQIKKSQEVTNC
jgi:prophage regulatory protein